MCMVCLSYSDQASSVPQLIRLVINLTLVCVGLDLRLVNYETCRCFPVEPPLVLPVGVCGRAWGCHTEQPRGGGGLRQNQHAYICCACPHLSIPAIPAHTSYACLHLPIPAIPANTCHAMSVPATRGYTHSPTGRPRISTRGEGEGRMWLLRLTHKVYFISIQNVSKISRRF